MRRSLAAAAVLLVVAAAPAFPIDAPAKDADMDRLASWLSGSFTTAAQAKADPDYRDIRLHHVPIWKERPDGPWLYVEQAVAEKQDAPYRQRVLRLVRRDDGSFESRVYTFPDPLRFAGDWRKEAPLAALRVEDLAPREGCTVVLKAQDDGSFGGGTEGTKCASDLRGAAYATSEVVLTARRMISWDRGFDGSGAQVWGATKGGYVFEKE